MTGCSAGCQSRVACSRRVIKVAPGSDLLLVTDGFLASASDHGAYNADSPMAEASTKGLKARAKSCAPSRTATAAATSFAI